MSEDENDGLSPQCMTRIAGQADKLVAAGRLTVEEADRLRAAPDASRAEQVVREIRARHASERLDVAVAEGAMSRLEADDILARVGAGEHSRALRSHLSRFSLGRRKRAKLAEPGSQGESGKERPA